METSLKTTSYESSNKRKIFQNSIIFLYTCLETPNREAIFKNSSQLFQLHTEKLSETAKQIANSTTQSQNKRTIESINELAKSVSVFGHLTC